MSTPVIIDPVGYSTLQGVNGAPGPVSSGSNLYCVIADAGTTQSVFKSGDGGVTWANFAVLPHSGIRFATSPDHTRIWFIDAAFNLSYFNAVTESFGPAIPIPADAAAHGIFYGLCQTRNGFVHLSYSTLIVSGQLKYSFFDGANFSAPVVIMTSPGSSVSGANSIFFDNADDVHIAANNPQSGAHSDILQHWSFSNTGTALLGPQTIDVIPGSYAPFDGCASGDSLILPVAFSPSAGASEQRIYIGTPALNPSWTFTTVDAGTAPIIAGAVASSAALTSLSALVCYVAAHDSSSGGGFGGPSALIAIQFAGSMATSTSTIYDANITPPAPPLTSTAIIGLGISVATSLLAGILFGGNRNPSVGDGVAYFVPFIIPIRAVNYCFGS